MELTILTFAFPAEAGPHLLTPEEWKAEFVYVLLIQICGAFVFGAMSFTDKLSSGVAIAAIQQFSPRKYVCRVEGERSKIVSVAGL